MISTPELDSRLRRHHQELVTLLAAHDVTTARVSRSPSHRRRWLLVAATAVVVAAFAPVATLSLLPGHSDTNQVGLAGFSMTVAAGDAVAPRMTRDQAIAAVQRFWSAHPLQLPHGGPVVSGLAIDSASFTPSVERVVAPCMNVSISDRENLWVIAVSAPAQSGWQPIHGGFLVNDANGSIAGGDLRFSPTGREAPQC